MGVFDFLRGRRERGIRGRWFFPTNKIDQILEIDTDLKQDLSAFKTMVLNYQKKLDLIHDFVKKKTANESGDDTLEMLRKEMDLVKLMVEIDDTAEKKEERYTIRAIKTITMIIDKEEKYSQKEIEEEVKTNLHMLKLDLEKLRPLLATQLDFFRQSNDKIDKEYQNIQILLRAVKDEAVLLGIENSQLKELETDITKLKETNPIPPQPAA